MKKQFKLAIERNMHSESYAKKFQKYLNKLKSVNERDIEKTDDEGEPEVLPKRRFDNPDQGES